MSLRRAGLTAVAVGGLVATLGVGLAGPASAAPAPAVGVRVSDASSAGKDPFKGLSPEKIKNKAVKSALGAKTVHVRSYVAADGDVVKVDAVLGGRRAKVRFTSREIGSVFLVRDGAVVYFSGDRKFWQSASEGELSSKEIDSLVGKWVRTADTDDPELDGLRELTTLNYWVSDLRDVHPTKRVAGRTIAGTKTVGLLEPGRDGGVLYVASKGTPFPAYLESTDKTASITYLDWNKRVVIEVPPAHLVIAP